HVDGVFLVLSIDEARHGGEEAHQVRRTALQGGALPARIAPVARARQAVDVEEAVAGSGDARQRVVVHATFHHVYVLALAGGEKQRVIEREEHQYWASRGIGGNVRQGVWLAEAFIAGRAGAAGDVHLPLNDISPHALRRIEVVAQTGQDADIGERDHQREAVH